jgi:hypothetical protein
MLQEPAIRSPDRRRHQLMTTLRRTFRVAASPEQFLQFVQLKLAGPDDRIARIRLDGVWARGFHLLRTAENLPEHTEWVAAARVHLASNEHGTVVTIEHAGTVMRRNGVLVTAWGPLTIAAALLAMAALTLLAGSSGANWTRCCAASPS